MLAFVGSYFGQRALHHDAVPDASDEAVGYTRIVSLAPSITEVIYALGLEERLVGVTNFCNYPPAAQSKPKVGGIIDTNYEAILQLEADLVILYPVHRDAQERLKELGQRTLTVDCRTLDGILESISLIGKTCQVSDRSDALLAEIHAKMNEVRARTAGLDRPTVLISAGRSKEGDAVDEVYAAGRGQWYDDLIAIAGGENVFTEEGLPFPTVTGEGLVRLNPEVIIEMAPADANGTRSPEKIASQWDVLPEISAVRNRRVYVLDGDYTTIPGPRFIQTVEDLARVLHPEIDWNAP